MESGSTRRLTVSALTAVWLVSGVTGVVLADYDIPWHVFGSGGGWSTNGVYEAAGTVGHANATQSASTEYELGAGFWQNGALCPIPANAPTLTVQETGANLELSWNAVPGAAFYDVIRGDLVQLRSTGGDFAAATSACVADDEPTTSVAQPAVAGDVYFLVRPVACAEGSYDSADGSQNGARDNEIAAAASACP